MRFVVLRCYFGATAHRRGHGRGRLPTAIAHRGGQSLTLLLAFVKGRHAHARELKTWNLKQF